MVKKILRFKKINEEFENKLKILNRQALHAKSLGFIHPTTKKFRVLSLNYLKISKKY